MGIPSQRDAVHVAVGVIRNEQGEVLIARRHDHLHQGGCWEFPGGKVESHETVEQALRRELLEELSIIVKQANPLIKIAHDYGDKKVLLDVWQVTSFAGVPLGMQGQPIRWVAADKLGQFPFPVANRPIVAAARLPEQYPIVDGSLDQADRLLDRLDRLARRGCRLAQWRVRTDDEPAYLALARRAVDVSRFHGLALLLNAGPGAVTATGAAGVHLTSKRLMGLSERPLPDHLWVAASCHGLDEIRQADRIGVDFIVLSPVLFTPSHPEVVPLGWDHFGALVESANLPVYALGGMSAGSLSDARRRGARGVAGIRGFLDE